MILIGERTNITGSAAFGRAMEDDRLDDAAEIGRRQVAAGAKMLDVCLAGSQKHDELALWRRFLPVLLERSAVPIVIDSLRADVFAFALERAPRGSVANSLDLASVRGADLEQTAQLVAAHGAWLVLSCADDDGFAESAERKLDIARRGFELASTLGLEPDRLLFDPLAFPASPARPAHGAVETRRAVETLRAVAAITDRLQPAGTILGISDFSYGHEPGRRPALNAAYLHHAEAAGLTHAILNTERNLPYDQIASELSADIEAMFAPLEL